MTPDFIEGLIAVVGLVSIGGVFLVGMKMRYSHKEKMRVGEGGSAEDTQRLEEEVATLRDEVHGMRDGFAELYERVEFAERLLTKGRTDGSS